MVIDDFGHNPDKVAATLATLKAQDGTGGEGGPVIAFFQPHGFGPLRQMGAELAATFGRLLGPGDRVILCDPVYFGGTVDRSVGSERIVEMIGAVEGGPLAEYIPGREDCGARMVALAAEMSGARPAPRIVVMGARDDTLSQFAWDILARLG